MSSEKVAGVPEDVRAAATEAMGLMDQPLMAGRQPTRSMELAMILARHILTPRQWPLVTEEGGNLPVALRNTEITERDVETLLQAARDMIQPRPQDQPLPPVTEEQVEVLARNLYGPPMTDAAWRCVEGTAHWIVCMNHARIALEFCRSFGE